MGTGGFQFLFSWSGWKMTGKIVQSNYKCLVDEKGMCL